MGHILDLVPNHMGIAKSANPWWQDVLENGPSSRFAHFFDIEWHPVKAELADKLLIPILGDQYGVVLERQELRLAYERRRLPRPLPRQCPADCARYVFDHSRRPSGRVAGGTGRATAWTTSTNCRASSRRAATCRRAARASRTTSRRGRARRKSSSGGWPRWPTASADGPSADRRRASGTSTAWPASRGASTISIRLLNQQSYRLAHWRVASEEINYRRFFDVNQLAALRMEDPAVFDEVHRFALELVHRGAATGLRVDHVDGLYAPGEYLRRLQAHCAEAAGDPRRSPSSSSSKRSSAPANSCPRDWPVAGTTGYEFAAVVNNLFVDRRNARALDDIATRFARDRRERLSFADLAYRSKKQVMHETMSGDINSLGHQLNLFSERNRHFRDFTLYSLISTIKEVIACFPVYRTYVTEDEPVSEHDRRYIAEAIRGAKRRAPGVTVAGVRFHRAAAAQADPRCRRRTSARSAPASSGSSSRSPVRSPRRASKIRRCTCTTACCR